MNPGPLEPARLPPSDLDGLAPEWSRLVSVTASDGCRTFHVLDTAHAPAVDAADVTLTVLCVHGNPSWSYLWRHLLRTLPAGTRGIALDHLDMGFSDRTGTTRRLAQRIDDLCALTAELGITGPVVTVAHDWGGPISLGWAQRHTEQLQGVVLTNTAVHQPEGAPAPRVIRAARSRGALHKTTVDSKAFITGAFEMSHPRTQKAVRRGFTAPYETSDRRLAIKTFVEDIPLEPDHPTAETLDAVRDGLRELGEVPTLLLWGARDLVFSDLYLHDLEARLPHADVHRWAHAGHFVTEDAPVAEAVADWLGQLTEPGTGATTTSPPPPPLPPAEPTRLLDAIDDPARATTVAIAEMSGDGRSITFGQLSARIDAAASTLAASGIATGDRVAIMIPPGVDLAVAVYACWKLGAVVVLVDGALTPPQMGAALKAAYPKHLLGIPKALAAARAMRWPGLRLSSAPLPGLQRRTLGVTACIDLTQAPASSGPTPIVTPANRTLPSADDEAAVVFTSGSTGPSKGVRYTHRQIAAQRDAIVELYDITPTDRLVAAFAPFALYGPTIGITSVVPDMDVSSPGSLSAGRLAEAVDTIDASLVFASPAALENLVRTVNEIDSRHRSALDNVRLVLSAGAPVRASLLHSIKSVFPAAVPHTPYGMTEALPVASISLPELDQAGLGDGVCVGRPLTGVDVDIRSLDSPSAGGTPTDKGQAHPASTGEMGEVIVRAPHARLGYDRLWHTTHRASQPPGWHATGDVGYLDDDGRLWIGGRLGHLISTANGPVAPVGLEKAVEELKGVAMAAVVGVGPTDVQQIVVVIQSRAARGKPALADRTMTDAVRACTERDIVAVFEVPQLPVDRRHNSKIDRTAVAKWAAQALSGGPIRKL